MYRRGALVALAAAVPAALSGCLSDLPNATGPRQPPSPSSPPPSGATVVEVTDVDVSEAPDGSLRVVARVENRGGEPTTREVVATATLDGEKLVRSATVDLAPEASREVTFDFETPFGAFVDGDGSVSVDTR